jgi:hypothetical protein
MGKPPSIHNALDGPELYVYRHIAAADFDPRQWRSDATGRLIIHRDGCLGPSGQGTCRCHQYGGGVDILWLVPQGAVRAEIPSGVWKQRNPSITKPPPAKKMRSK